MPTYEVEDQITGKTLEIDAPDEATVHQAMRDYHQNFLKERKQAAEGPGLGERMGLGALSGAGLPVASVQAFRDPNASGVDRASAVFGDIGGAAMTGAGALMSGGVVPAIKMLGGGAALGAAQGAIAPLMQTAGEAGRRIGAISPAGILAAQIPDTQSQTLNFLKQLPEATGQTLGQLAPAAALSFLGAKLGMGAGKPGATPEQIQAFERSRQTRIPLSQGQLEGPSSQAAIREKGYAVNPATANIADDFYKAQEMAKEKSIGNLAASFEDPHLMDEIMARNVYRSRIGGQIAPKLEQVRKLAGQSVGETRKALATKLPIASQLSDKLGTVIGELQTQISKGPILPGSDRAVAIQKIGQLQKAAKQIKTPDQWVQLIRDYDDSIANLFKQGFIQSKSTPAVTQARKALVEVGDALISKAAPAEAANLRAAKQRFAGIAGPTEDLLGKLENVDPQEYIKTLLTGPGKVQNIDALKKAFANNPELAPNMKAGLLQEIIGSSMDQQGNISTPRLHAQIGARGRFSPEVLEAVFGKEDYQALKGMEKLFATIEEGKSPIGTQAKGGSQTQKLQSIAGAGKAIPGLGGISKMAENFLARREAKKYFGQKPSLPKGTSGFMGPKELTGGPAAFLKSARQPISQEQQRKRAEQQLNMILDRMGAK